VKSVEQALLEWVDLCDRINIGYAIMGGLAVRVHGIPRPTYDVDLTINADAKQLKLLFAEAEEIGYTVPDTYKSGWLDRVADMPIAKLRTWLEDGKGIDVDLFISESTFQDSLMSRRVAYEFEGRKLTVVTPEDLVLLKLLANRPRDIGDVQDILFMQGQLDESYMNRWAAELGIADRLSSILANRDS
jgi:predicted nucleotidyltransferase